MGTEPFSSGFNWADSFELGSTFPNFIAFTCRFSIQLVSTVGLPSPSSVSQSLSVSLTSLHVSNLEGLSWNFCSSSSKFFFWIITNRQSICDYHHCGCYFPHFLYMVLVDFFSFLENLWSGSEKSNKAEALKFSAIKSIASSSFSSSDTRSSGFYGFTCNLGFHRTLCFLVVGEEDNGI